MEILLVNCPATLTKELQSSLMGRGHAVAYTTLMSVAEGLLRDIKFDCVIVEMQRKNLTETMEYLFHLRSGEYETALTTPIIGICAKDDDTDDMRRAAEILNFYIVAADTKQAAAAIVDAVEKIKT